MTGRLIYAVGPSGAGKDSLLAWLKAHLSGQDREAYSFAKRTITRSLTEDAEQHESLSIAAFEQLGQAGAFALQWRANGLSYGIRHSQLQPMRRGVSVILNGSRAHAPVARSMFPNLLLLHITASPQILRQRLLGRGRESLELIEARLQRTAALSLSSEGSFIEICNDGLLDETGASLLRELARHRSMIKT
jgi:ribose 1,5-bisphosphokinase